MGGREWIERGSGGCARASSGCRWRSCGSCGHGCAGCRRASRCGRASTPAVRRSITASIAAPPRCSAGARPEPGCGAGAARHAGAPSRRQRGRTLARLRRPEAFQQVLEDMLGPAPSSLPGSSAPGFGLNPDDGLALADAHSRGVDRSWGDGIGGIVEADEKFFREFAQGLAGMGKSWRCLTFVLIIPHLDENIARTSARCSIGGREWIERGSGGCARASSGCRWRSCGSCGHGCAGCRRASRCGRGSTPAVRRSITASIAAPPRCSAGARPEPGCGAGAARHAGAPSRRQRGRRWRASAGRRRSSRCWRTCWARPRAPAGFSAPGSG